MATDEHVKDAGKERKRSGTRPMFLFAVMVTTISSAGLVSALLTDLVTQARLTGRQINQDLKPAAVFLIDHPMLLTMPVVVALLSAVPVAVRKGDLWWQLHALMTAMTAILAIAWVVDVILGGLLVHLSATYKP
jgi:hypothetical protein